MLLQMVGLPSFLRLNNIPFYVYTAFSLYIHLLVDICFHILATENKAVMNREVQLSFQVSVHFLRINIKSRIAGLYGSSIFNF